MKRPNYAVIERCIAGGFLLLAAFLLIQQTTYVLFPRRLVVTVGGTLFDIESMGDWSLTLFLLAAGAGCWYASFAASKILRKLSLAAMIATLLLYGIGLWERSEMPGGLSLQNFGITWFNRGPAGNRGIFTSGPPPAWRDNHVVRQFVLDHVCRACWAFGGAGASLLVGMVHRATSHRSDDECARCGYSFVGLISRSKCPECGAPNGYRPSL